MKYLSRLLPLLLIPIVSSCNIGTTSSSGSPTSSSTSPTSSATPSLNTHPSSSPTTLSGNSNTASGIALNPHSETLTFTGSASTTFTVSSAPAGCSIAINTTGVSPPQWQFELKATGNTSADLYIAVIPYNGPGKSLLSLPGGTSVIPAAIAQLKTNNGAQLYNAVSGSVTINKDQSSGTIDAIFAQPTSGQSGQIHVSGSFGSSNCHES